jgi:hypothetical protein
MDVFNDLARGAREFLNGRRLAYLRVFDKENEHNPDIKVVMDDLAKFCRAHESTFHPDPRTHALLEGRKEVWYRIQQHLNLTEEELWSLFNRKD